MKYQSVRVIRNENFTYSTVIKLSHTKNFRVCNIKRKGFQVKLGKEYKSTGMS